MRLVLRGVPGYGQAVGVAEVEVANNVYEAGDALRGGHEHRAHHKARARLNGETESVWKRMRNWFQGNF